jgi:glutathione S-transferase
MHLSTAGDGICHGEQKLSAVASRWLFGVARTAALGCGSGDRTCWGVARHELLLAFDHRQFLVSQSGNYRRTLGAGFMSLVLYFHPLASFCHKVLVALYEAGTSFEGRFVDFQDEAARSRFFALWPMGKIPVLRDEERNLTVPESTVIVEYLDRNYPGERRLFPADEALALDARLWDRFIDLYVHAPMQKIVLDHFRPEGEHDVQGVAEARTTLATAYGMVERRMADRPWLAGDDFTVADCAAAPALFYAATVQPFAQAHPHLASYFERLTDRPSVARTITEAQPYFQHYPFRDAIPARFLSGPRPAG